MGRKGKEKATPPESPYRSDKEDDVPIASPKRTGPSLAPERSRGRGRPNPMAGSRARTPAPGQGSSQGQGPYRARTKHAYTPDSHYDDYSDLNISNLAHMVLRPSPPPRTENTVAMVNYMKGGHDVYALRYDDPSKYTKEFLWDIRFWLRFNADWYDSVILKKENITLEMQVMDWEYLRKFHTVPGVLEAIDACHDKGVANLMNLQKHWNEEVIAQFYATLYIDRANKVMHFMIQGKPLSVSYEHFAALLSFGTDDLAKDKIHDENLIDDSRMAFMYDPKYGHIEFGTTHGMMPLYRLLNQFIRKTLSPKVGDQTNISNIAKNLLLRLSPGQPDFSVFDFIWEEIIVNSVSSNMGCKYAPWIFYMICKVTGVRIKYDKEHTVYKPAKGHLDRLLKLGKYAPKAPAPGTSSFGGTSALDIPSSSQAPPPATQGLPPSGSKKKSILNFLSQGLFACFNVGQHNANKLYEQEKMLYKMDARQKALLDQANIEHSPVREFEDYPPPPNFYNPWEEYSETSMMYGVPPPNIFGGDDEDTEVEESPPAAHGGGGNGDDDDE